MTEAWKVYIKGVPDRGNEVIKMLEGLGAKNPFDYDGNRLVYLYYIWHDGSIHAELIDNEYGQIIMDNYCEITLSEKWNDGDLLVCHMLSGNRYAVYSDDSELMKCNTITTYVDVDNYTYGINGLFDKDDFKLASNEEYKEFYELLHKKGKEWDFEHKKLINWRWKPEINEDYWYINDIGEVCRASYTKLMVGNDSRVRVGNCFQTKDDAFAARLRIKEMLLNK